MSSTHSAERLVAANGVELCTDQFGDPRRPAMVLIMGLGTQMISWEEDFCKALADRGLFVVRFDNRDIGRSTWLDHLGTPGLPMLFARAALGLPLSVPYSLADMARDTVGLLDALGIESAHVVGASMGGAIAQEIAIRHSGRVRSLASLFSSTGDPMLPPPTAEAVRVLLSRAPSTQEAFIAHHANVRRVLNGPNYPVDTAESRERAIRNYERGVHPAGTARQLAAILASGNRTAALRGLKLPTLVLHGDRDPLINVAGGRATAAAIPGARLEIIAGMGHTLPRALWPRLVEAIADHALANRGEENRPS